MSVKSLFFRFLLSDPRHDLLVVRPLHRVQRQEEARHHQRLRRPHHREGQGRVRPDRHR